MDDPTIQRWLARAEAVEARMAGFYASIAVTAIVLFLPGALRLLRVLFP